MKPVHEAGPCRRDVADDGRRRAGRVGIVAQVVLQGIVPLVAELDVDYRVEQVRGCCRCRRGWVLPMKTTRSITLILSSLLVQLTPKKALTCR